MTKEDLEKYVLEQAKIEVEHTRSWPTKILAFYVAINAGVVTALFSLNSRTANQLCVPCCAKLLITLAILGLLLWAFILLKKNHNTYLKHRNIQVHFQKENAETLQKLFPRLPPEWLSVNELSLSTRCLGWGFYFYLMAFVTALGLAGVWIS